MLCSAVIPGKPPLILKGNGGIMDLGKKGGRSGNSGGRGNCGGTIMYEKAVKVKRSKTTKTCFPIVMLRVSRQMIKCNYKYHLHVRSIFTACWSQL